MLVVILIVLSIVGGRLLQLQGLDQSHYSSLAQAQRLHTVTLSAERGDITDNAGQPIAETVAARDVIADPTQVVGAAATAAKLAPLLGISESTLVEQLTLHTQYSPLAMTVTPALGARVMALGLPGIYTTDTSKRVYPDGTLAANIIGFVNSSGQGGGGLEYSDNKELAGANGRQEYEAGVDGDPIPDGKNVLDPATPGDDIRLTIQRDIQYVAQQAIAKQVSATHALSGTVIVEDPATGKILAMAVAPTFNPNHYGSAKAADLGNPAISDPYEPGSVSKVVTMSAGLEDGLITPTSHFVIPPSISYGGSTFRDAETHGYENLTSTGILAQSSNIGAIEIAKRLGAQRLDAYEKAYGFGQPTGVGLPGESAGELIPLADWSGTTLPTLAFGQGGVSATAMQVSTIFSTIANDGVRVTPSIVAGTTGPTGDYHAAATPASRRVISTTVAAELRQMMESVVSSEGTAPEAEIPGYTVAGKTGTANRSNGASGYKGGGYTASFVGMVPAEHPKLVCEVVVEDPKGDVFGGSVAGPVFKSVMSFALQTMGVTPSRHHAHRLPNTW